MGAWLVILVGRWTWVLYILRTGCLMKFNRVWCNQCYAWCCNPLCFSKHLASIDAQIVCFRPLFWHLLSHLPSFPLEGWPSSANNYSPCSHQAPWHCRELHLAGEVHQQVCRRSHYVLRVDEAQEEVQHNRRTGSSVWSRRNMDRSSWWEGVSRSVVLVLMSSGSLSDPPLHYPDVTEPLISSAGGSKPNLADLAVFGVLRPIRHLSAGKDMVQNTGIGEWLQRMELAVGGSSRIIEPWEYGPRRMAFFFFSGDGGIAIHNFDAFQGPIFFS